ncbi:jmjC domain containing protein [Coccidioides posadasii C735 delta SOWgp]|uniref:JmjC domain-containing histone demethylation protein 1 n=1 Tax=Coccidioides posadasii (strain C735) TaxID=222929 RepID=C5PHI7_COCP7|nr:jmjC domain containing protein [Coccidioides posadasii C735 delta SOWgp]EER23990.1 jmjC domain containing protein [Coccidioides posadasii C735 delta SOWgp]|eukprot:XP_003066135.1 jmjC domain containing protein [Coccidioides posadasii C735 delta SOWgp]
MAASMSFRRPSNSRPPQYRTPSPPRYAVEPLSPHASAASYRPPWDIGASGSEKVPTPLQHCQPQAANNFDASRGNNSHPDPPAETKSLGRLGHSRTGSNIDTLATIALATRARFGPLTYSSAPDNDASTISFAPVDNESRERPPKRARSERSPSPAWQTFGARPATSHTSSFDSMKTDAELLLNFARPANFPPRQPIQPAPQFHNSGPEASNMESKWNIPPPNVPDESFNISSNKVSAAFFGGSGALARVRSRSDGAAALSRPTINGYNSGPPKGPPPMGPVLEDESNGPEEQGERATVTVEEKAESRPPKRGPKSKGRRRQSDTAVKSEDADSDSSNQTNCAACSLVRVPMNNGDDAEVTWVNCDGCNRWFHIVCAGFKNDREIRTVDKFICKECRPVHGPTTFVRKSSRPKTSIDYAGLNQGFVKPSTEAPDHHYIQPIKAGKMTFLPDHFARLPAEFVTAEYFEHGIGMPEPVVIPAHLNPRTPASALGLENYCPQFKEASSQEEFDAIIDSLPNDDDSEEVIDCCQDLLDMVIPNNLTVRTVGELYGLDERVEVIDVKSQQGEDKRWNMRKWVDYYYDSSASKTVRNVISLEVSQSPLGKLIRRPKIVRDLDLQDAVWPNELKEIGDYPKVQFYCLMSVADCYTDFHVDFGGSSVYYHIIKGKKTFFFIPPKEKHLKKYEEWCNSTAQDTTFLADQTKECYRVDLSEGDTMLIPSGWIHAVWTPEDSLVIGGNFLTRMNYGMQIKIAQIEKDTKVPRKFRYPFFQKIMWYTAFKYLDEDPVPQSVLDSFARDENYRFYREYPLYYQFGEYASKAERGSDYYNSRFYSQAELDGLPDLAKYLLRTALIAGGYMVDGVTKETRNAVSRSIPKGQGDPIETVVKFGIWVAWKRGNEPAAQWTRPGAISLDAKVDISDKRRTARPTRRSERNASNGTRRASMASETSKPMQGQNLDDRVSIAPSTSTSNKGSPTPAKRKVSFPDIKLEQDSMPKPVSKGTNLGPKRVACDACRKRRIRCRHKAEYNGDVVSGNQHISFQSNGEQVRRASEVLLNSTINTSTDEDMSINYAELAQGSASGPVPQEMTLNYSAGASGNSPNSSNSAKKGRNKACDECRKSKRRCIHDESGKVDPVKAQERAKPRTGITKRPRSSDGYSSVSKRSRLSQSIHERPEKGEEFGAVPMVASHLNPERIDNPADHIHPRHELSNASEPATNGKAQDKGLYASPAVNTELDGPSRPEGELRPAPPTDSLVSPPTSLLDGRDEIVNNPEQTLPIVNDNAKEYPVDVNTPASTSPKTPHPTVREISPPRREEYESLKVAVPDSAKDQVISTPVITSKPTKPSSRPSSSHKSKQFMAKEVKQAHPAAERKGSPSHMRHNASPTSPQNQFRPGKRDRVSFAEINADEESLKLIKELQEQEFGLRKRSTRA